MKYLAQLYFITAFLFCMSSYAAERSAITGVGAFSCGQWIEGRTLKVASIDNMFIAWMQGFLSGMNMQRFIQHESDLSLLPDAPTILAYVDKACDETPLEDVYLIAIRLYQDIQ